MEAFRSHPRIGESRAAQSATAQSASWSAQEQKKVAAAGDAVKIALAEANRDYEQRFRAISLSCALRENRRREILEILRRRLQNDDATELQRGSRAATTDHTHSADKVALAMKRISTHVLDTAIGKPATGMPVRLERAGSCGNWALLALGAYGSGRPVRPIVAGRARFVRRALSPGV